MKLVLTSTIVASMFVASSVALVPGSMDRRSLLQSVATAAAATAAAPSAAQAGLLDEFGADPNKIVQKDQSSTVVIAKGQKGDKGIDPTLRASYYYPTAKKRYLPRIQKVSNTITVVPPMIDDGNWEGVSEFYKTADNAILPMKLYVSSLDGQGLGMSNSYAKQMMADCKAYETQCGVFGKAIERQDRDRAMLAVSEMGIAVTDYRQTGRLTDDDGNIPSVDELRRLAMRKPTGQY